LRLLRGAATDRGGALSQGSLGHSRAAAVKGHLLEGVLYGDGKSATRYHLVISVGNASEVGPGRARGGRGGAREV